MILRFPAECSGATSIKVCQNLMKTSFKFVGLPSETFPALFDLSNAELAARNACRMIADAKPGYPCRVSLVDAEPGETVLLVPYLHHDLPSPYRASGPIFVRKGAVTANLADNEIPSMFMHRLLSVRAYVTNGRMVAAEVVAGDVLEALIRRFFENDAVDHLHVHNARPAVLTVGWNAPERAL
jgi:hypothetical protein